MILLYTMVLVFLAVILFVVNRRVSALERRYAKTALAAELLIHEPQKGGTNRADALESAKRQLVLGQLAQRRDKVEAKWHAWQRRADRVGRMLAALKHWKGQKLPYTFGALDVTGALYLVDRWGVGPYLSLDQLIELVRQLGW